MADSLGQLLITLRHARGLTQMELCARVSHVVGLVQPQISELENDNMSPNAGQLEHIMRALEATDQDRRRCRDLAAADVVRR
jgi:transcriptional regulator with XRE-family HTH domain